MSHEITLEQAAKMAHQAGIVCTMLESHPDRMADCELSAIASLLKKLTGNFASWLIKEQAKREGK